MNHSKKHKKRKGSSLVVVLMVFTVLFILSAAVMGTLATGLKLRSFEKNQVENLYGAESGITLAQAAVERTFITATDFAQQQATSEEVFEQTVIDFIGKDPMNNKYAESAKNLAYYPSDYTPECTVNCTVGLGGTTDSTSIIIVEDSAKFTERKGSNPAYWEFTVQSDFTEANILRRVQADFKINAPTWDGNAVLDKPSSKVLSKNLFTIDGDFILNNSALVLNGDIVVKGNEPKTTPTLADQNNGVIDLQSKYSGGIYNNATDVVINGIASTNHNVINRGGKLNVGSIYAQNVLIENQSKLEADKVIVDNDLVMNTKESAIVKINNFYGINDKSIDTVGQQRSSSSIIVNQKDTLATINIKTNAYIAGTAFVDLAKPYQTGESVAVNGNYQAYTLPVSEMAALCSDQNITAQIGECEDFVYEYIEPLQLITGKKIATGIESWTVQQKATYFAEIAKLVATTQSQLQLQHGNVSLPDNTFAAGAVVRKKTDGTVEVLKPATTDKLEPIKNEQKNYANQVYRMGLSDLDANALQTLYNSNPANILTLAKDVVDFTKGTAVTESDLVYNPDSTKTVEITNGTCDSKNICMKVTDQTPKLVITNGNVIINDTAAMGLTTTVMASGDVTINTNSTMVNKMSEEQLAATLEKYTQQLQGVLRVLPTETRATTSEVRSIEQTYYDVKEHVKVSNWQLIY
ncbi:MAG: hypothetical protein ACRC5Q_04915 [Culicoidibacterales bacterium]